ncbi:septum formation inhibitor Maf [Flavisericum labens]|uniref:septum formation inhibitor Maf n=1 Tax=Flavisericum labens TaxID=3377112 RepID=UPI00387AA186
MNRRILKAIKLFGAALVTLMMLSCKKEKGTKDIAHNWETKLIVHKDFNKKQLPEAFKKYWYAGEAEISSYKLEQARYGEIRKGKAVLVYVTEDFLPNIQVKAGNQNNKNIPVLKLNATKKFNTGIYPYSIMQSTFYPVSNSQHALKVSSSIQEWCGHVYAQLNNRQQFEVVSHSYFQGEADQSFKLEKTILENELWIQLRINPKSLPTGNLEIIPSPEFTRLKHVPIKAYRAEATLTKNRYSVDYPELNRKLTITFNPDFPYDIISWEETFKSGFGANAQVLTTKATKLNTIKSAYWQKNSNSDEVLRQTLQLD